MRRALIVIAALGALALGCSQYEGTQYERAVEQREIVFEAAELAHPVPNLVNFPLRAALVKFTQRQDMLDHPWFVYVLGDNGNVIGYYVAQTKPINSCNFLSSTEKMVEGGSSGTSQVLTAPSLDGIFYGGGGSAASCDAWFWFDAATDTLVEIRGVKFFVADSPLALEAEPITVAPQ